MLLSYLIGLTYTAKREHLNELGSLWPLAALAVPAIYGVVLARHAPLAFGFLLIFAAWVLYALWLLRRRAKGDVPRAVVSLIAGISLLDAMILCGAGAVGLALLAVLAFAVTLLLQRWVRNVSEVKRLMRWHGTFCCKGRVSRTLVDEPESASSSTWGAMTWPKVQRRRLELPSSRPQLLAIGGIS